VLENDRQIFSEFKSKNKGFVVYCSLGSQNTLYRKKTRIFFKRLLNVARKNPEDMFILSAGEGFNISEIYPVPQNLFAFKYLPQSDLLGRCDIMISHGGMNSITECVSHGVPMLIYPTWPYTDLYGNSARVVYHGLGLRGKVMSDNEKAISKKLNLIKSSYSKFRNKVLLMRKKFEQMNNSKDVLNIIEGVIKQTSNKNMQYESEGI
jgi:zeaxanthin glucosyltransferase